MAEICTYSLKYYDDHFTCPHPVFKEDDFCVFHSEKIGSKASIFRDCLLDYVANQNNDSEHSSYDFRGWIFPETDLSFIEFNKEAYFNKCLFKGRINFQGATFSERVEFGHSEFWGDAYFHESTFKGVVSFTHCRFLKQAVFSHCNLLKDSYFAYINFEENTSFGATVFHDHVNFSDTKFHSLTQSNSAEFMGTSIFMRCEFHDETSFSYCKFRDDVNFNDTKFHERVSFKMTQFRGELEFINSRINQLKYIQANGINFEGSVLNEVIFWNIDKFIGFSFKNSFLLSASFAEKEFVNCDFTGAVFDSVRTRGWKLDETTLSKTEYIYTDYIIVKNQDASGEVITYEPIQESRVPANGIFGVGENLGFTLSDYLRERYKWTRAIKIPQLLRTDVLQYIQLFTDFSRITEGINVELRTFNEGGQIRVDFLTDTKEDKEHVEELFKEYLYRSQESDVDNLIVQINHKKSSAQQVEIELFEIHWKSQIRALQDKLAYSEKLLKAHQKINELYEIRSFNPQNILLLDQCNATHEDIEHMKLAIVLSRSCITEAQREGESPKVGVVIVKDKTVLAAAYRGQMIPGEHAEFTALEKILNEVDLSGSTVYTTLEPCTSRNHPKIPCAQRLIERNVKRVYIGMLDPNPDIRGLGQRILSNANIETQLFPQDLAIQIEEINKNFTLQFV